MNYKKRFDPDSISDEDLLSELKKLADYLGRTPSYNDIKNFGNDITKRTYLYRRRFGSIQSAQEKIGYKKNLGGKDLKYDDNDLLNEILSIQKLLNKTPTQKEMYDYGKYPPDAFKRHFGTYNNALKKLGIKYNIKFGQSEEEIKNDIIRVAKILGRTPKSKEFEKYSNTVSWITAAHKLDGYNSWNNTLKLCGLETVYNKNLTENDLKTEILRLQSELQRIPGYYDMVQFGRYSPETYANKFGTYVKALHHFGFEYTQQNHWFNQTRTKGLDGTEYRSKFEAMIADILFSFKNKRIIIDYKYEEKVCIDRGWTCDFLIKANKREIWLEADGMGKNRPEVYDEEHEKIKYYIENDLSFYILSYSKNKSIYADLFNLVKK